MPCSIHARECFQPHPLISHVGGVQRHWPIPTHVYVIYAHIHSGSGISRYIRAPPIVPAAHQIGSMAECCSSTGLATISERSRLASSLLLQAQKLRIEKNVSRGHGIQLMVQGSTGKRSSKSRKEDKIRANLSGISMFSLRECTYIRLLYGDLLAVVHRF